MRFLENRKVNFNYHAINLYLNQRERCFHKICFEGEAKFFLFSQFTQNTHPQNFSRKNGSHEEMEMIRMQNIIKLQKKSEFNCLPFCTIRAPSPVG